MSLAKLDAVMLFGRPPFKALSGSSVKLPLISGSLQ